MCVCVAMPCPCPVPRSWRPSCGTNAGVSGEVMERVEAGKAVGPHAGPGGDDWPRAPPRSPGPSDLSESEIMADFNATLRATADEIHNTRLPLGEAVELINDRFRPFAVAAGVEGSWPAAVERVEETRVGQGRSTPVGTWPPLPPHFGAEQGAQRDQAIDHIRVIIGKAALTARPGASPPITVTFQKHLMPMDLVVRLRDFLVPEGACIPCQILEAQRGRPWGKPRPGSWHVANGGDDRRLVQRLHIPGRPGGGGKAVLSFQVECADMFARGTPKVIGPRFVLLEFAPELIRAFGPAASASWASSPGPTVAAAPRKRGKH